MALVPGRPAAPASDLDRLVAALHATWATARGSPRGEDPDLLAISHEPLGCAFCAGPGPCFIPCANALWACDTARPPDWILRARFGAVAGALRARHGLALERADWPVDRDAPPPGGTFPRYCYAVHS